MVGDRFSNSSVFEGNNMRRFVAILALVVVGAVSAAIAVTAAEEGEAKYSIKEVMKEAHGKKLLNKVLEGEASAEEKTKLLDLYLSLLENKPKKGEEDSWHGKAEAVVLAAAKVAAGRESGVAELKTATNCAACHQVHK
jgi:mono/diheme cytochrome c family protein